MYNLTVVTSGERQTSPQLETIGQLPPVELVTFVKEHFKVTEVLDCGFCPHDIAFRSGHLVLELPNSDELAVIELSEIFIIPREQHLMLSPHGQGDGVYQDSVCVKYIALGLNGSKPPDVFVIGDCAEADGFIWKVGPLAA